MLKRPPRTAPASTVSPARLRTGSTSAFPKPAATPWASKPSSFQCRPRTPAVIEPPETLEIRSSLGSQPASFRRQSDPTWNSMAR